MGHKISHNIYFMSGCWCDCSCWGRRTSFLWTKSTRHKWDFRILKNQLTVMNRLSKIEIYRKSWGLAEFLNNIITVDFAINRNVKKHRDAIMEGQQQPEHKRPPKKIVNVLTLPLAQPSHPMDQWLHPENSVEQHNFTQINISSKLKQQTFLPVTF